jgi:hypothetical protein
MQLRYDEDFVEGAVFICANRRAEGPPPLQVRRFHRERERLYAILDPDERNAAFFALHLEWFREWGLEKLLLQSVDEFPELRSRLNSFAIRKARARSDEGAELYVSAENGRVCVAAICVERFNQPAELATLLRHELTHINDMLNPDFGYSPQPHLPGQNAAQQRLTRERYRLLWDITIDGRLVRAGRLPEAARSGHRAAFDRVFGFWAEARRDEAFDSLWLNARPSHGQLLAIASDPRDVRHATEPAPGTPCPLCSFPTFDWAGSEELKRAPLVAAIQAEFPHWLPGDGACRRCVGIYRRHALALVEAL